MRFLPLLLLTATTSPLLATAQTTPPTLAQALTAHANLTSLANLLKTHLLEFQQELEQYNSSYPITFLAPSNTAFTNVVGNPIIGPTIQSGDAGPIENVLRYHVIPGQAIMSTTLNASFEFLPTLLESGNLTNVTGGQRIGGVLQGGTPPEMVFVSGESSRSVVIVEDITFAGG